MLTITLPVFVADHCSIIVTPSVSGTVVMSQLLVQRQRVCVVVGVGGVFLARVLSNLLGDLSNDDTGAVGHETHSALYPQLLDVEGLAPAQVDDGVREEETEFLVFVRHRLLQWTEASVNSIRSYAMSL